uniref:Uncharacterized protein n=1 Tax=Tanacetum cinerariifolium TaxID=118510 RepID=A0A6L2KZS6_TANCI|nr:hypothetical protein [Tanacetum cinerariifolium]
MTVNFNVFSSSMMDGIRCQCYGEVLSHKIGDDKGTVDELVKCFEEDGHIGGDGCIGDGDELDGVDEFMDDGSELDGVGDNWIGVMKLCGCDGCEKSNWGEAIDVEALSDELLVLERIVEEEEDGGILVVVEDVGVSSFATVMLTTLVLDWFVVVSTDDSHFKSNPSRLFLIGVLRPIVPRDV